MENAAASMEKDAASMEKDANDAESGKASKNIKKDLQFSSFLVAVCGIVHAISKKSRVSLPPPHLRNWPPIVC